MLKLQVGNFIVLMFIAAELLCQKVSLNLWQRAALAAPNGQKQ
jgi:hypothetical protein